MPMYISITDERIEVRRQEEKVGGMFWQVEGPNASCVFETVYRAKQENAKKWGYMYDLLKAGKKLKIRRNNAWGDAIIFAATGVTQALKAEQASQYAEDEYTLLYAS